MSTRSHHSFPFIATWAVPALLAACGSETAGPPVLTPAAIAAVSGTSQTGTVGQGLAQALTVRVTTSSGAPVPSVSVTWAASAGGGALSASNSSTNANGEASVTWTLGTVAGTNNNTVTATVGSLTPVTFNASANAGPASQLVIVSGNTQAGTVGQQLPQPLIAATRDQYGNAIAGSTMTWAVTQGGGGVSSAATTTNAQGQASVSLTLGTMAGVGNNVAQATATGLTGSPASFTATANAGNATQMSLVSGSAQSGTAGQALAQPLVVVVRDQYANGVPSVTVTWGVTSGGGALGASSSVTNAQGDGSMTWTLGPPAGAQGVSATVASVVGSPVAFGATAAAAAASQIVVVSGNGQSATVATTLASPLVVRVTDVFANPVQGTTVTWTVGGGGSVPQPTTISDASGETSTSWTLGTTAGSTSNTLAAGIQGSGATAAFRASATPGPASTLAINAGDGQTAPAGTTLPAQLSVKVADTYGNGIAGVNVDWLVVSGAGSVSTPQSSTNGSGIATAGRTLGPFAGTHTASGSVSALGSTVTFTATATPNGTISGTVTLTNDLLIVSGLKAARADATVVAPTPKAPKASRRGAASIAGSLTSARRGEPRRVEHTPDELIVTFRSTALNAPGIGSAALRSRSVVEAAGGAIRARLTAHEASSRIRVTGISPVTLAAKVRVSDPALIDVIAAELRADPAVLFVQRNAIVRLEAASPVSPVANTTPNDPLYPWQAWHYSMIDLPQAWDITRGSASVLVAVVDDGIRFDHPAIAANLTSDGRDFVSDSPVPICGGGFVSSAGDGDGYDADPTVPVLYEFDSGLGCVVGLESVGGHGLHVAATIGAVGNDGASIVGVNWTVRIRPVRVLSSTGSGTFYDIAQGVLYAAGLAADNGAGGTVQAPTAARIINMSLGGPSNSPDLQNAILSATNAGALVIAAAGNDNVSTPFYPAAYDEVVSVSAVGPTGVKASYSNFGATVDIAAPGGDRALGDTSFAIYSAAWDFVGGAPAFSAINGTSMAAPHVSGVAALLLAQSPSLTNAALRARLTSYAVDLGAPGRDDIFGAGLVNARSSLTQSFGPPLQLYARLLDAATGSIVQTTQAQVNGAYAFTGLADGNYLVFAGQDENGDGQLGLPGRRWGALGGTATATPLTVTGAGTYPASFPIGLPSEIEPNGSTSTADLLVVGGYLFGFVSPSTDFDVSVVQIPQAGQYTFETFPGDGACGFALEEDTILGLYDSTGTLITSNDDINVSALQLCSRITTTLTPGIYYLGVAGYSGGRYQLRARSGT